eukprot:XP_001701705.1 predicted protein [Chlamydomonas reinhardtii]
MAFPLHDAAKTGNVKAVNELLAQQVDVNQKDRLNRTPLHMAAWAGQTDVLKLLLAHGCTVGAAAGDDMNALHFAAQKGHSDAATKRNETPMQLAKDPEVGGACAGVGWRVPTSRVGVTAAAGAGGASSSAAATATAAPPAAASSPAAPDWSERFRVRSVPEQFRETRQKVCKEFLAGGLLYLESGEAPARNGSDVFHRHRSHSHFVYVTGCMAPGYGALIDAETGHFTLLAPRLPEEAAYWVGAVPSLEQLQQQYGADRQAQDGGACRPGLTEFQLEAVFAMSSRCRGAPDLGYPVIVGTGPNAAVMHYEAGPAAVEPGHLVLVDAGAEWRGPLAPGMVVTVEPGAYLIPPLLAKARADPKVAPFINFDLAESLAAGGLGGVRIEDNGRLFNLTVAAGCAKEMREVEDVMAEEWRPAEAMSRVVG